VTTTINRVADDEARALLACMKFGISLERIGDLLLSFVNRADTVAAHLDHDDLRDLIVMTSRLEQMLPTSRLHSSPARLIRRECAAG